MRHRNKQKTKKMAKLTVAHGNTYEAKESLKKVGFIFNKALKRWEAESFDRKAWEEKYCSCTYIGRKAGTLNKTITFTQVEKPSLEELTY